MIKPELYHKTVGILYDAYFNDTLERGNCHACAVGNMIAANCKIPFDQFIMWSIGIPEWDRVFRTAEKIQIKNPWEYSSIAKEQIDSTGYSWKELAKIEFAFETASSQGTIEDKMFAGLVAVLKVLKEIHQVTDEDLLQSNNKRFKDHYNKRVGATV